MSDDQFEQLVDHYITGSISAGDRERFFVMLEQEEYRLKLEQILKKEWDEGAYEEEGSKQAAHLIEQYVLSRIEKEAVVRPISFFKRYRIAIAAAAMLIVAVGLWLMTNKEPKQAQVVDNSTKIDIAPGSNGATLTMSNGTQIILDSTGNGAVFNEGSTKITKTADGKLEYTVGEHDGAIAWNKLTTDRGKQFFVKLPDGTGAWLNAASWIRYPAAFKGKERKVEIGGEVYLEVAKNERAPFIVVARNQDIQVLGTHFNVNAYEDEIGTRTTLLEGSIKIIAGAKAQTIKPGEQSLVSDNNIQVQAVNVNDAVAWKNGFFSFRQSDIKAIMRQVARWYDVDIQYQSANTTQTFSGKIDRNLSLSEVLKILEKTKVSFRIDEGRKLVILPPSNR